VNVQYAAIGKMHELMLAPARDTVNSHAGQGTDNPSR
jgi:hypothetical protein